MVKQCIGLLLLLMLMMMLLLLLFYFYYYYTTATIIIIIIIIIIMMNDKTSLPEALRTVPGPNYKCEVINNYVLNDLLNRRVFSVS